MHIKQVRISSLYSKAMLKLLVWRCDALLDSTSFVRRVVGSNPTLAAT